MAQWLTRTNNRDRKEVNILKGISGVLKPVSQPPMENTKLCDSKSCGWCTPESDYYPLTSLQGMIVCASVSQETYEGMDCKMADNMVERFFEFRLWTFREE